MKNSYYIFPFSIGHDDCSIFPLMGTILGNDYADSRLFENIYSHIQIPKNKSMNDQHRKILGLLEWLKNQTVEEAIEKVYNLINNINCYILFYFSFLSSDS